MEVRRLHKNGAYIYEMKRGDGLILYIRNINPLDKEKPINYALSLKLERKDRYTILKAENCLFSIEDTNYLLKEDLWLYTIPSLLSCSNKIIVYDFSKDSNKWTRAITKYDKLPQFIKYPFQIVSKNRIVAQDEEGRYCVTDLSGNIIVPFGRYSKIDGFKWNVARVRMTYPKNPLGEKDEGWCNQYGIIDINGKEVVECVYDTIYKFYGNNKAYTTLFKGSEKKKFHLGYQRFFGSLQDIEYLQYLEDQGVIKWEG